jgi:hypothetical protein
LKLRTTEEFTKGKAVKIALVDDPLNELGNAYYEAIGNETLQTFVIAAYSTGIESAGDEEQQLEITSQPNPFNGSTKLEYNLPYSGEVMLEIFNKYGSRVAKMVDTYQEAGHYFVRLDGTSLQPGVYTVILYLKSRTDEKMTAIKIVRGL